LQEQYLEVVNQGVSDVGRPAMLEHVLPEGEVGEESEEVVLEVFTKETLSLLVGLHFAVIGEWEYDWQVLWRVQDRQLPGHD
jgi:hypothetical protein